MPSHVHLSATAVRCTPIRCSACRLQRRPAAAQPKLHTTPETRSHGRTRGALRSAAQQHTAFASRPAGSPQTRATAFLLPTSACLPCVHPAPPLPLSVYKYKHTPGNDWVIRVRGAWLLTPGSRFCGNAAVLAPTASCVQTNKNTWTHAMGPIRNHTHASTQADSCCCCYEPRPSHRHSSSDRRRSARRRTCSAASASFHQGRDCTHCRMPSSSRPV